MWRKFVVENLGRAVAIGKRRHPGWRKSLEFYRFKCPECGAIVETYASGFYALLLCPRCLGNSDDKYPRLNDVKIGV